MRSFLLHAQDEQSFDARLQVALDVARGFDGHLSVFQAIPFSMIVPTDPYGIAMVDISKEAKAHAKAFRSRIEERLQGEDVRWDWIDDLGMAASEMLEHAVLADLAIVGASDPDDGARTSRMVGTLALHCRAPVLVVPDNAEGMAVNGPAMVCWNGSAEASRALRAAVPLLQKASSVTLVEVSDADDEDGAQMPALSGARYLDRHGIECEVTEIPRDGEKVSTVLKRAAQLREVSCIVMGAYGRPRLYETVFGGVTRDMITDPVVPVLLTH